MTVKLMDILIDHEHIVVDLAKQVADIVAHELSVRLEKLERDAVALTNTVQSLEGKLELLESEADNREQYARVAHTSCSPALLRQ